MLCAISLIFCTSVVSLDKFLAGNNVELFSGQQWCHCDVLWRVLGAKQNLKTQIHQGRLSLLASLFEHPPMGGDYPMLRVPPSQCSSQKAHFPTSSWSQSAGL